MQSIDSRYLFYSSEHISTSIERNISVLFDSQAKRILKIADIGRIGLVSVIAIIIVIAAVGVYTYTDTSQIAIAKTILSSADTTTRYATTYTTPFIIANGTTSNNTKTKTEVNNYTVRTSTVPSSKINSTNSSALVESSETPCIPTTAYISTMTLTEQNTTSTEQLVYDGTSCNFGDANEAPSAILISANTLVWTDFRLNESGSYSVIAGFDFLPIPEAMTANLTIAVYLNGKLNGTSPYSMSDYSSSPELTNTSQMPPSNSSGNSIFALPGVILTSGISGQADSLVNLSNTTITVAIISNKPLWLCGWTPEDMAKGTGPQFGQSVGQLNGTYEWPDSGLTLPNSLPRPSTTLTFELQISGNYN